MADLAPSSSDLTLRSQGQAARPSRSRRWLQGVLSVVTLVLVLAAIEAIRLPAINSRGQSAAWIKCQSNLKLIGYALLKYSNAHSGRLPSSLTELLEKEDITADVFVCPAGPESRADGPTTQATLVDFAQPGHCSYIYLGAGLKWTDDSKQILAYEPLSNHHDGLNVLFGDGHPEFFLKGQIPPWISAVVGAPPRERR